LKNIEYLIFKNKERKFRVSEMEKEKLRVEIRDNMIEAPGRILHKKLDFDCVKKHYPVFHEMGFPIYNEACWICSKCNLYMGNNYEKGSDYGICKESI